MLLMLYMAGPPPLNHIGRGRTCGIKSGKVEMHFRHPESEGSYG
jgi:hypothetical protein